MFSDQEVPLDLRAADFSQAPYPAEQSRSTPVCLHQILGKLSWSIYMAFPILIITFWMR